MSERPVVDDRDQEELLADLRRRADQYTRTWDPAEPDNGTALLRIFGDLADDVVRRLNDVPEKHELAFLDALDFDRRPPQAAQLPLTFEVSDDLDRNVAIPGGATAIASAADGSEQIFEVPGDAGFEATPATLTDAVAVVPEGDCIVDHGDALASGQTAALFAGDDVQDHVLYLGGDDLLTLQPGSPIGVEIEADASRDWFRDAVTWEYYGLDADGTEDWHALDDPAEPEDPTGLDALKERFRNRSDDGPRGDADGAVELGFELPGEVVPTTVAGHESRWLRCRLDGPPETDSPVRVDSVVARLGRDDADGSLEPDGLMANDVPLSTDDVLRPFGRMPQPPATLYLASEEALTKRDATVRVTFSAPDDAAGQGADGAAGRPTDGASGGATAGASGRATDGDDGDFGGLGVLGGPPEISWEYWNGSGWAALDVERDGTDALRESGSVVFRAPADFERTSVSGHEDAWIRARLVSGNYGHPTFEVTDDGARGAPTSEPEPPEFGDVAVGYEGARQQFDLVLTDNNGSVREHDPAVPSLLEPFRALGEDEQTLYLGFDDRLENGPIVLFVPVEDATYPQTFDPGARWEYCDSAAGDEWEKLEVRDYTAGLTERGMVTLNFPAPTSESERFGRRRHWIRVRVTQDEFDTAVEERDGSRSSESGRAGERDGVAGRASGRTENWDGGRAGGRQRSSGGTPSSGGSNRPAPVLHGIYPNTQWATNTRTVEDEILGSSDGSHDQSFEFAHAPVVDVDVWVDEHAALSAPERRSLLADRPGAVEQVTDARGDCTAFWVRWESASDFLDAGRDDRRYVVDRTGGTVRFGDGDAGAIPPNGRENVRATYTTGGGRDGNVGAGTITDLKSAISLVESVTNPHPADGGADAESTEALVDRATARIRHRGRAVCADDYEQVTRAEFREIARVRARPQMGADGETVPGWVTLLVVPKARREKPVPSVELKQQVRETVAERAPATLVDREQSHVVVRGPRYAEIHVTVRLRTGSVKSVSLLKRDVERALDEFLHPLTGSDGEGWAFGEAPTLAELCDRIERHGDVGSVAEISAVVDADGDRVALVGRQEEAQLPRDALVCSGRHDVTVTMEGEL